MFKFQRIGEWMVQYIRSILSTRNTKSPFQPSNISKNPRFATQPNNKSKQTLKTTEHHGAYAFMKYVVIAVFLCQLFPSLSCKRLIFLVVLESKKFVRKDVAVFTYGIIHFRYWEFLNLVNKKKTINCLTKPINLRNTLTLKNIQTIVSNWVCKFTLQLPLRAAK